MNMKRLCKFSVFAFFFFFLFLVPRVYAQDSNGLNITLEPSVLELSYTPGINSRQAFRLYSNSTSPIKIIITVDKLSTTSTGEIIPTEPGKGDETTSWFSFEEKTKTLLPKEWTTIPFTITIPKDALYGNYFAIKIAQEQGTIDKNGALVVGQVVLPVFLDVNRSKATISGKLVGFSPLKKLNEYLPVSFETKIENLGNIRIKPRGNIFIRDMSNTDVTAIVFNPSGLNVLPGSTRTFSNEWNDGFIVNIPKVDSNGQPITKLDGKPVTHLVVHWNKLTDFRFGKYNAYLITVYDNGQRDIIMESTAAFWVVPYTAIGFSLLIFFVALFIIRLILRIYIKSQIHKARK